MLCQLVSSHSSLTSRPLSPSASGFPPDPRLTLHSGLDLSKDSDSIIEYLKNIDGIKEVTHVYFAGRSVREEREKNESPR